MHDTTNIGEWNHYGWGVIYFIYFATITKLILIKI